MNSTNQVARIAPDDTVTVIAGTGTADPAAGVQTGAATSLDLTPAGIALTPNGSLLISSGHVVYRLIDPANAPAAP